MSEAEAQTDTQPPQRPWFQFSPRTLLLLFVVLAASLAVFGAWGIGVFALAIWMTIDLCQVNRLRALTRFSLGSLVLIGFMAMFFPAIEHAHVAARAAVCNNNLKQIAEALRKYRHVNGRFPPAFIADSSGKPIHSWRVLILPYMELDDLYKSYNFNEAWDGPNNKKFACPISVYACPSDNSAWYKSPFATSYVAVVGPKGEWPCDEARVMSGDRSRSDTVMVVEVTNSGIPWMDPRDLSIDDSRTAASKPPGLVPSGNHLREQSGFFLTYDQSSGFNAAMADGSVKWMPAGSLGTNPEQYHINWPNIVALAVWLGSVGILLTCAVRSRNSLSVRPIPVSQPAIPRD